MNSVTQGKASGWWWCFRILPAEHGSRYVLPQKPPCKTRCPNWCTYRLLLRNWTSLKNLNIRYDTIKLLEKIIGKTFSDINHTNVSLGQSPKAIEIKTKINKLDLIKLTSFGTAKETINKMKRQPTEWEKIFAKDATGKCLISQIYKQLINSTTTKKNKQPNQKNGQQT